MDKPSFVWSSISKATRELAEGFEWQVGMGFHINITKHRWGFEGLSGNEIKNPQLVTATRVRDLWHQDRVA